MEAVVGGYRQSHISKGQDYQADFQRLPPRKLAWKIEQRLLGKIVQRFLAGRSIDYLDFACGTGRILSHLERHVSSSTGIDVSEAMLKVARSRSSRSRILQADLTRERVLGESSFDLITAFRFFPNAEPQLREEALGALAGHLKQDGILVFNNHRSTTSARSRLARLLTKGRRGNHGMSPQEVHELIAGKGLQLLKTYHLGIVPETESRPFKPRWFINIVEQAGTRLPLSAFAGNIIYVCRPGR